MILLRMVVMCLWILIVFSVTSSFAEEQRCKDLGVNCVCSEPLNTTNLPIVNTFWYNPADSIIKPCTVEPGVIPGLAISRNGQDLFGSSDATVRSKLPAGHQVSSFVRAAEGHTGSWFLGGVLGSQFVKRAAYRWYLWVSPNFQWTGEGACGNGKLGQTNNIIFTVQFGAPGVAAYNFMGYSPSNDCCGLGPYSTDSGPTGPQWKNKWWRLEIVFTNRSGGASPNGERVQMYAKNVTDNLPERLILDTNGSNASGSWIPSASLTPPSREDAMTVNSYREGTCQGYFGHSHYMLAGWDTDAGQRIGPATEIEGGGGDTTPPIPPTVTGVTQP